MLRLLFGACTVLIVYAAAQNGESKLVIIQQGPVRGYKVHKDVFGFYNIPYATAPTGRDKFKAPLPPPKWSQPFEARNQDIRCPQFNNNKHRLEDCLVASVFVPDTQRTDLPVMVNFHGGGYQIGFGNEMTPIHLVKSKRIIAVTFNYRLGITGFLCLGTPDIPGNAGLKDQLALLRWVKNNIGKFGGNPNDITIEGVSAGSSSVGLLMLSKAAKGLFHKVIPESGAVNSVWAVQQDPLKSAMEFAKTYGRNINFTNVDDFYALEEFYKSAPIEFLTLDAFYTRIDSTFLFAPCVERETGVENIITDSPVNILFEGDYDKLPMLYGVTDKEGIFRLELFDEWKVKMNKKFSDFLPADLKFDNEYQKEEVARKVKTFYFGDKPVSEDNILGYVDYVKDVMLGGATLRSVEMHVEAGHDKIYLYEYSFVPKNSPLVRNVSGANHGAQTNALLDDNGPDESFISEDYKEMKSIMRELWLNFITHGCPVPIWSDLPSWPPVDEDGYPHMELNLPLRLKGNLMLARKRFWDDIYYHHYREPVPPPAPPRF